MRESSDFHQQFGARNMVIYAHSREASYPKHVTPVSLKCVFEGSEVYETNLCRYLVTSRNYLVFNHGQMYASHLEGRQEVSSLAVFWEPETAADILDRALSDGLLEGSKRGSDCSFRFVERLYPSDDLVTPSVAKLRRLLDDNNPDPLAIDEQLHNLLERLVCAHTRLEGEIQSITALRYSTRMELYSRLYRARDFIEDSFSQDLTLDELAGVACLSKYHFLRAFRQLFGLTPHAYLTRKRLDRARQLLLETDHLVNEVCAAVGFDNPSSFVRLFRLTFKQPPNFLRRANRRLNSGAEP
jgi:AraC-like DNA-binding protein